MRPSVFDSEPLSLVQNIVVDVLVRYYERIARKDGIEFNTRLEVGNDISISDADLCAVLSNLLENAVEACRRQSAEARFILIGMKQTETSLLIRMENSANAHLTRRGEGFLSSKEEGRNGYGLNSATAITKRCGGEAEFLLDDKTREFTSVVLLKWSK